MTDSTTALEDVFGTDTEPTPISDELAEGGVCWYCEEPLLDGDPVSVAGLFHAHDSCRPSYGDGDVDPDEYVDLTNYDRDVYECQKCGNFTDERFEHGECPSCSGEHVFSSRQWAREFSSVDHGPGFTGNRTRSCRLDWVSDDE